MARIGDGQRAVRARTEDEAGGETSIALLFMKNLQLWICCSATIRHFIGVFKRQEAELGPIPRFTVECCGLPRSLGSENATILVPSFETTSNQPGDFNGWTFPRHAAI